jgi:hypothetical protein
MERLLSVREFQETAFRERSDSMGRSLKQTRGLLGAMSINQLSQKVRF